MIFLWVEGVAAKTTPNQTASLELVRGVFLGNPCASLRLPIEDVGSPNSHTDGLKMLKALDQRSFHDLEQTMPKSVNKVILVGNVGADPEIKYTPSGIPVGKFSLATNERFKNKSGEWQDRTEWHNIVAWQRLAEIVGEYVSKGSKVYIEGKLQTSSWRTGGAARRSTGPRSWLETSCCWACERTATRNRNTPPAANSVSLTMPGLAKSRMKIFRSKTDLPEPNSQKQTE